jgi:putative Mg2+ transporter-C (MgtC) family protein
LLLVARLLLAAVLGGAVGWERLKSGQSAGLRTHMLVCVGATMFTAIALLSVRDLQPLGSSERVDPVRIVQALAIGIGFLGSGVVYRSQREDRVKGVTTAAGLWCVTALGIAIGQGYYVLAVGATVLLLVILNVVHHLEKRTEAPDL